MLIVSSLAAVFSLNDKSHFGEQHPTLHIYIMKIYTKNIKKDFTCTCKNIHNGYQLLFNFPNNYTASVVEHDYSNGLEIAVLDSNGTITYDTPITDDTLGYLTDDQANDILGKISRL